MTARQEKKKKNKIHTRIFTVRCDIVTPKDQVFKENGKKRYLWEQFSMLTLCDNLVGFCFIVFWILVCFIVLYIYIYVCVVFIKMGRIFYCNLFSTGHILPAGF